MLLCAFDAQKVEELCDAYNVILECLLPYSPDFSPIGEALVEMKGSMKVHNEQHAGCPDFAGFLEAALRYYSLYAGNYFRAADIAMDEE